MRKASEVTDPAEIERIWAARNIGRQPYAKIEEAFGLRPAGGMTALRVCGIHESRKRAAAERAGAETPLKPHRIGYWRNEHEA